MAFVRGVISGAIVAGSKDRFDGAKNGRSFVPVTHTQIEKADPHLCYVHLVCTLA